MTSTDPRWDGSLAKTPPMGQELLEAVGKLIDGARNERQAEALVETGMIDAASEYLVIDGGWRASERDDDDGNIHVDREECHVLDCWSGEEWTTNGPSRSTSGTTTVACSA